MKTIDLFCGCGGMSLGFQNAGFKIICAVDNWEPALESYRYNFSHPAINMDIYSEEMEDLLKKNNPDIIIGGPPCQDFSIAGKGVVGKRGNLTRRYSELVSKIKPTWFVMENVYNIEKKPVLGEAIANFKNAGYGLTAQILDASRYEVPQTRQRYFLIGKLGEEDDFLKESLIRARTDKQMTLFDYVGDSFGTEFYYMHPRNYQRRAVFSIYEPSSTIRGVNRPIPDNYKRHPADKCDIGPQVRSLTAAERSYIQTFPPNFIFKGTKTQIEQQIGNAVPVKLAENVARCILSYVG